MEKLEKEQEEKAQKEQVEKAAKELEKSAEYEPPEVNTPSRESNTSYEMTITTSTSSIDQENYVMAIESVTTPNRTANTSSESMSKTEIKFDLTSTCTDIVTATSPRSSVSLNKPPQDQGAGNKIIDKSTCNSSHHDRSTAA